MRIVEPPICMVLSFALLQCVVASAAPNGIGLYFDYNGDSHCCPDGILEVQTVYLVLSCPSEGGAIDGWEALVSWDGDLLVTEVSVSNAGRNMCTFPEYCISLDDNPVSSSEHTVLASFNVLALSAGGMYLGAPEESSRPGARAPVYTTNKTHGQYYETVIEHGHDGGPCLTIGYSECKPEDDGIKPESHVFRGGGYVYADGVPMDPPWVVSLNEAGAIFINDVAFLGGIDKPSRISVRDDLDKFVDECVIAYCGGRGMEEGRRIGRVVSMLDEDRYNVVDSYEVSKSGNSILVDLSRHLCKFVLSFDGMDDDKRTGTRGNRSDVAAERYEGVVCRMSKLVCGRRGALAFGEDYMVWISPTSLRDVDEWVSKKRSGESVIPVSDAASMCHLPEPFLRDRLSASW